jgi:hypothetical protein
MSDISAQLPARSFRPLISPPVPKAARHSPASNGPAAPQPALPPKVASENSPIVAASPKGIPRVFAGFSVALGSGVAASCLYYGFADAGQTMPPIVSAVLLVILLLGTALGIVAVGWNKNPRRKSVRIMGIAGICLNALFLLLVCGSTGSGSSVRANHIHRAGVVQSREGL